MTGELLAGRYQLEQELGRGGMATVFLATDLRLARRVAVKVMHPGGDESRTERFRREAELVASLKHPNVLEIHDFGEDAARGPFLVCEWVQGESLRELARRLSPVPPEAAAVLGWALAEALGEAHARGVVHRDVKPENVLVARGGPLKLADFGIAALADQERLTSTGAITGSLPYMAPERIDTGAFSPASDVYAVGVMLFELCTGTTPHGGKGAAHLAASVMTKDAPPLTELVPGTPEPLSTLVARCLARDSRDRPASGEVLAPLLEEVVGRIAGSPAEESRAFFQDPLGYSARRREARFQQLLSEGRALLAKGQGARAAKVLNGALALQPDSPEVVALLRERPQAGRRKVLALGVALAVVLGGLAWGASRWLTPEPAPLPSVQVEPAPQEAKRPEPEAVAVQAPEPQVETPSPVARLEPVREGSRPEPKKKSSGSARPSAPRAAPVPSSAPEAPRSGSPTEAPPPAEPVKPATLKVTVRPWAEVFVDGKSRGYTPRVREVSLSPGEHRLRLVNPLCDTVEEVLQVSAGETVTREVALQVRKAEVHIAAPSGARVFIDGVEAGVAPLSGSQYVEHGRHVISARVPGGPPLRREVEVVAGTRIEVVLEGTP
ncbi:serine/threonine-protein kinase [Hyalangium rubrum]|uniref:Protein kinase n=1 Tax=Hyalangium rubrum TaxID=3103134 RepID=A0ABU5H7E8_9BACT|nr:protein kinase [Hyalangium sp. s54d21]MDY7229397.1 protein kinase [Hyalangium sp. s54d21]